MMLRKLEPSPFAVDDEGIPVAEKAMPPRPVCCAT